MAERSNRKGPPIAPRTCRGCPMNRARFPGELATCVPPARPGHLATIARLLVLDLRNALLPHEQTPATGPAAHLRVAIWKSTRFLFRPPSGGVAPQRVSLGSGGGTHPTPQRLRLPQPPNQPVRSHEGWGRHDPASSGRQEPGWLRHSGTDPDPRRGFRIGPEPERASAAPRPCGPPPARGPGASARRCPWARRPHAHPGHPK